LLFGSLMYYIGTLTLSLVGLISLLCAIGCVTLTVVAACVRVVVTSWVTRPQGFTDAIKLVEDRLKRVELDNSDTGDRLRRWQNRSNRQEQRERKRVERDEAEAPERVVDVLQTVPPTTETPVDAKVSPPNRDAVKDEIFRKFYRNSR